MKLKISRGANRYLPNKDVDNHVGMLVTYNHALMSFSDVMMVGRGATIQYALLAIIVLGRWSGKHTIVEPTEWLDAQ